jgi:DNA-binding transcriptional LysR family regulator
MAVELTSLRMFLAVADRGGISAAAEELHTVQSNVTARIKKLEGELDTELFRRHSRGMALTAPGRVLRDYAERLLRLERQAQTAVRETAEGSGELRLGAMETAMAIRLPSLLMQLHRDLPAVQVSLATGHTEALLQQVLDDELDAALVGGPVVHPELVASPAFTEELVLVTGGEGSQHTLLVFTRGCVYRARAEQWARESGQLPLRIMEYGTLEGILGCVAAGLGCTLVPRAVVERQALAENLEVHSLPKHIAEVSTLLVRRADAPGSVALKRLQQLIDATRETGAATPQAAARS